MEAIILKTALILHIVAGHLALLTGLIMMIRKKGDRKHVVLGKIYFPSMLVVGVSAFYLSIVKDIPFLFFLSVFVVYQLWAGWMTIKRKHAKPRFFDWIFLLVFVANGVFMILTLNIVLIVFGSLTCFLTFSELRFFVSAIKKPETMTNQWLARHIGFIVGSYIGAVTAFLVVNVQNFEPVWLIWILPTIVLAPLIRIWTVKHVKTGN